MTAEEKLPQKKLHVKYTVPLKTRKKLNRFILAVMEPSITVLIEKSESEAIRLMARTRVEQDGILAM